MNDLPKSNVITPHFLMMMRFL